MSDELTLGIAGFSYADLFEPTRLHALFDVWEAGLREADAALHKRYADARAGGKLGPVESSQLLLDVAPHVSGFVARLFGVAEERLREIARTDEDMVVFRFKDQFVKRRALKKTVAEADRAAAIVDGDAALARHGLAAAHRDDERAVAKAVVRLLDRETELKTRPVDDPDLVALRADLARIEAWVVARKPELAAHHWHSLHLPHTTDYEKLVQIRRPDEKLPEAIVGPEATRRARDGFALTDRRGTRLEVLDQVDYCIYCHDRDKDSCSKGLKEAKTGAVKKNPLGIQLDGCPLEERISEMHTLKRGGDVIGSLAMICVDNPMLPGTGHRICNDCMKSCIYQKQEPVNIPLIETTVLTDVLQMPWGVEIYGLLTRWNPLNLERPYPLPYHGKNVLVVGLGPAGYTLAHHLVREGFGVVAVDGLKLEPLSERLLGSPIRDWKSVEKELDERLLAGFGGVSEYGITVRWDKNFLDLMYVTLSRLATLRMYGGVRFGGTLTLDDAWKLGFDHVALAAGAGKPTIIDIENNLIRGIRKASDFLMGLQLTGAYKRSSLANLQVRLPAVVIGGGLTGIDTATELRAYYVVQCERTLGWFEKLVAAKQHHGHSRAGSEAEIFATFDGEEREILEEQLVHGRALRAERDAASQQGRAPDFNALLDAWGGVSLVYRKSMLDSPAYRLNHEEIIKCLEEGVRFVERLSPKKAVPDERGALKAMVFERQIEENGKFRNSGELVELPARTVCVAAGTSPNTIYEKERPGNFVLEKTFFKPFRAVRGDDGGVKLEPDHGGHFTSYVKDGRTVSYYGDNHPRYAGSVVKAMASAKDGFRAVRDLFADEVAKALGADAAMQHTRDGAWRGLVAQLDDALVATVHEVKRLTPTIVEVVVRAPLAAKKFRPGQFFRLQNYETDSPIVDGSRLTMEGLALTGAWTDPKQGLLSMIILEMGASSRLCAYLERGQRIVVMGPTGTPTEIPHNETVLLAGGGLGNAVLFSIGRALRDNGCRVMYFAGYRKAEDVYHLDDIEAAADQIVWSTDSEPQIHPRRPQDRTFRGNIVEAMRAYGEGTLGGEQFSLAEVDRVIAIGSDKMMAAVGKARRPGGSLAHLMRPDHHAVASINSPMQCMMKEVCAQCLQRHVDPKTGKETIVFSCFNQDQDIDAVDFGNLAARLRQNTVLEKLSTQYLTLLLAESGLVGV